jgi:hypothetical protein
MELNSIDVNEYNNNLIKETSNKNITNEINNYQNNTELKVSLVNIDSKFRNKIPYNIVDLKIEVLERNPIYTISDSTEVKLRIQNHGLYVGDYITIENIQCKNVILRDCLYFINNFDYCLIKYNNHGINNINNLNEIDKLVNISFYEDINNNFRMIGNTPINSILQYKKLYTLNNINISDSVLNNIYTYLNISNTELDNNYIFIKLPFSYSKTNTILNNEFTDYYNFKSIINLQFLDIGGIPVQYLNANYPIDYNKYQSKHYIHKVEDNFVYFNTSVKANFDMNCGGEKIIIGKITKSIDGYPDANDYVSELKKSFTNVVRIELLTTEIPFIDFNINNNINNKKNKLYWKYLEDGNYIYSSTIDEGFYNIDSLIDTLTIKMNEIERLSSTINQKKYNLFDVSINKNTQEVKFIAFELESLPNSLIVDKEGSLSGSYKVTITHPNNLVDIGDTITIFDSSAIGDIPASLINTDHIVYETNPFNDTFSIIILQDLITDTVNLEGNGGPNVKIQIPAKVSFLFDREDTIGEILGFKNPGSLNSITPYNHITSNFNDYILPNIYDEIGNPQLSNNLLNLSNNNYYMAMYLNNYEGIITNSNINQENIFSKILMAGNTGDILFNTFVNSPLEFDIPIPTISQFSIKFYYPDGTKPDFRNFEHSLTLRVTEKHTKPFNTEIDTTNQRYIDILISKANQ